MTDMTNLPAAQDLEQAVRASCAACTARCAVAMRDDAIDEYILKIQQADWLARKDQHGVRLPLQFDSVDDELNILATIALLNFLSGYRSTLHRLTSRGAYSTILSLVLSAYLSSPDNGDAPLSAQWMRDVTLAQIADLARIRTHREEDHPTLGRAVKVGVKDEEAFEVLQLLVGPLNETGRILQEAGVKSLGVWLRESLERAEGNGYQVVRELALSFPAFRDIHEIDGEPVYLLKKAFWLVTNVALRYKDEHTSFTPPSAAGFPIFADNVVPTMLVHHGILSLADSTDPHLRALSSSSDSTTLPVLPRDSATRLRAAAITASARLVQRAHELSSTASDKAWLGEWTEPELDAWIWNEAKGPELRDLARIAEKGTVYY
ncbi:hypothetical protein C6P46_005217 [Rhodotorula mucilaginosa]|uniref:Queuosine 5'-phosphate N-glycosylase/hydrolase n=1 Tax=Rhodotorula mucilaginosa TaxID=5537 RepID=A0A9P7B4I6_RHOMI|nr:hypothetical protein C6P46_005217 [Rhodotorula mucilaginosa]